MRNKIKMCFGIGGPSIIMIFVCLCLTTLAALSLTTANASYKLALRSANYVNEYYNAKSDAEDWLCKAYNKVCDNTASKVEYYTARINNNQQLEVTIAVENNDYRITAYKVTVNNNWDYDTQ